MTVEFGRRVEQYLQDPEHGMSANEAAYRCGVDPSHLSRVLHGDREMAPPNIVKLMGVLDIPPKEGAFLMCESSQLPEEVAIGWLEAFAKSSTPVEEATISEVIQRYIPKAEITEAAYAIPTDRSYFYRIWSGKKNDKIIRSRVSRGICENTRIPPELRAPFFLKAVGFKFEPIKTALESFRTHYQQSLIVAQGFRVSSMAVILNLDPSAQVVIYRTNPLKLV